MLVVAAAPAPPAIEPTRCLLIAVAAMQSGDANMAQAGKFASLYWMGRVNGASPGADLTRELGAAAKSMDGTNLQAEAARCGEEMKKRGLEMQQVGNALQAQGAPPPPK